MELRSYWQMIRPRLWLVGLLVLVVGALSGYTEFQQPVRRAPERYMSTTTIFIGVQPQGPNPKSVYPDTYDYYYANVASEYLADDFTVAGIMNSEKFARAVITTLQEPATKTAIMARFGSNPNLGSDITNPSVIRKAIEPSRSHRILKGTVSWPTKAGAWAIAYGIDKVFQNHIVEFLGFAFSTDQQKIPGRLPVHVQVEDQATDPVATTVAVASISNTKRLTNVLLRVALALVAGIALIFLLEYLNDTIRTPEDVARYLDIPVQGSIPAPASVRPSGSRGRKQWITGS